MCILEIRQFRSLFSYVLKIRNLFFFNLKTKKADCVAVFIKGQLWNKIYFCTFFDFLSFTRKDQLFFLQIGGLNSLSYKEPYSILILVIKNLWMPIMPLRECLEVIWLVSYCFDLKDKLSLLGSSLDKKSLDK